VYAGHAAVALALKTREPRIPMVPLLLACYGRTAGDRARHLRGRDAMALYTHYLPGLLLGALGAAALFTIAFRRPGAG